MNKPIWWGALQSQYTFPDDGLPTIAPDDLLQTLTTYVTGKFSDLLSPSFMLTQNVVQDVVNDPRKPAILVSSPTLASEVVGNTGSDYLSGSSDDDIMYGGANNDFFMPRGGRDFVIGSATLKTGERDTVSYETATAGIIVDYANDPFPPPPLPYRNYYSASYSAWSAGAPLTITGFATGQGGDIINVYDLMSHTTYTGSNPIEAGYIRLSEVGSGLKIQFDPDGFSGPTSARQAVILKGVNLADFSIANNLVTSTAPPPPVPPVPPHPSDYTFVSQDGYGGYDVLYSIENIIGSNFNDVIHGRNDTANILYGGAGDDLLYGEAGNDTLIGAQGNDTLYGGTGDDFFFMGEGNDQFYGDTGKDTYKFSGDYLALTQPGTAIIHDFQTGLDGDKIDVSELLRSIGYSGANAVTDGFIGIRQGANGTEILFDKDGESGSQQSVVLTTLNGVNAGNFSVADNLVTQNTSIILASVLGQSNAASLRVLDTDTESGITRLEDGLRSQTDFNRVYSVLKDENNIYLDTAIGGSVVNGDKTNAPTATWWYPESNRPGEILIRATDMLVTQIAELRTQGAVTPVMIWGQGETDAWAIGSGATEADRIAAQQVYLNATMSVFNYILDRIGRDVQIYIMETGYYSVAGATASNVSQTMIDQIVLGLTYIREAQEQIAMDNDNIHIAVKYTDLPLFADIPSSTPGYDPEWARDQWHLYYESKEVVGDRLADFIAQDLGFDHVIDNPGPYPMNMLVDLTIHSGSGMTIDGTANNNIITGTTGSDVIHGLEGDDAIVTGAGNDTLDGGSGVDTLRGGAGADTFVFLSAGAYTGVDVIQDFSIAQGDILDIFDLLGAYAANGGPISDFVQITQDGAGNSILIVDRDGAATGFAPVQIAVLSGVAGLGSIESLVSSGNLRVPTPPAPPPPVNAADDSFSGNEDTQITGNVLGNNGNGPDTGNGTLIVQAGNFTTAHGTVVLNSNGSFTYTPASNYNGADSFNYSVSDAQGSDTATVSMTINSVNDAPDAKNDSFMIVAGQSVSGNVLANNGNGADGDADNDVLGVIGPSVTTARGIVVSIASNGSFTYNAPAGFSGVDSFVYSVSDGLGGTANATVDFTITAPPNSIYGTTAGESLNGTANSDSIFGMGGNDIISGKAGNDSISSLDGNDKIDGGTGADTMSAGRGSDVYIVDNIEDAIIENFNEGTDTVYSTVSYSLAANVENLTLSGIANIDGSGNDLNNVLQGNDGNNTLSGNNGNDIVKGYKGNDVVYGNDGDDTLRGGDGDDTLYGGAGNDELYGESGVNILFGGDGNDVIKGGDGIDSLNGGAGIDSLFGLAGADRFVFDSNAFNGLDTVKDFNGAQGDALVMDNLLIGFDPLQNAITDFITKTQTSSATTIYVDMDGSGSVHSAQAIAILQGITGFDIQTEYNANHIIVV